MVSAILILAGVFAFLIGSIPFAFIAGRLFADIDIRQFGSGNPGASNTFRILGAGPGVLVLVLDAGKGALGVWLGGLALGMTSEVFAAYFSVLCGLSAVLGHVWSPWLGLRGGKGVGPLLGVFLILFPVGTVATAAIALTVVLVSRKFSLGSLVGALLLPACFFILVPEPLGPTNRPLLLLIGAAVAIVLARHVGNMKRLIRGREHGLRE